MKHKPTRFTTALATVIAEEGWDRIPDSHVIRVYEEHVRRLEAEIDQLKGDRASAPTRIDALAETTKP